MTPLISLTRGNVLCLIAVFFLYTGPLLPDKENKVFHMVLADSFGQLTQDHPGSMKDLQSSYDLQLQKKWSELLYLQLHVMIPI